MDTEVERLVVRMVGDMSHYLGEIEKAKNATQSVAKATEAAGATIEKFGKPKGGTSAFADYFRGAKEGADSVATSVEKANTKVQEAAGNVRSWAGAIKDFVVGAAQMAAGMGLYELTKSAIDRVKAKIEEQRAAWQEEGKSPESFRQDIPKAVFNVVGDAAKGVWDVLRAGIGVGADLFQKVGSQIQSGITKLRDQTTAKAEKKAFSEETFAALDAGQFDLADAVMGAWTAAEKATTETWDRISQTVKNALVIIDLAAENIGTVFMAAWREALKGADALSDKLLELGKAGYEWASGFVERNAEVLRSLAIASGAVLAAVGAYKLFTLAIAGAIAVFEFLHVQQIASAIAWGVWNTAVTAASVAVAAYSAVVAVVTAASAGFGIVQALVAAKTAIATAFLAAYNAVAAAYVAVTTTNIVSTTLWAGASMALNAVLVVTKGLLIGLIVASVGLAAIGSAFVVIASAAMATWEAIKGVYGVLASTDSFAGPIKAVGDLFKEWNSILLEVVATAKEDLPDAWSLLVAGAYLALEQVKQLFPPLWAFISKGFDILAAHAATVWKEEFARATTVAQLKFQLATTFTDAGKEEIERQIAQTNRFAQEKIDKAIRDTKSKLDYQAELFGRNTTGPETQGVLDARDELEAVRISNWLAAENRALQKPEAVTTVPDAVAGAWKKAENAVHAYDAALYGSADAARRLQEYTDRLADSETKRLHEKQVRDSEEVLRAAQKTLGAAQEAGDKGAVSAARDAVRKAAEGVKDAREGKVIEEVKKTEIKKVEEIKKTTEGAKKGADAAGKDVPSAPPAAEEIDESNFAALRPEKHYGGSVIAAPGASKASGEVANFTKTLRDAEFAALALDRAMIEAFRAHATGSRGSDLASITAAIVEEVLVSKKLDEARKAKVEAEAAASEAYAKLPPKVIEETKKVAEAAKVPDVGELTFDVQEALKMPSVEEVPPETPAVPDSEQADWGWIGSQTDEIANAKRPIPILDDRNSFVKWRERQDARAAELAAMPDDERDMWDFIGKQSDEVAKATVPVRDDRNSLVKFAEREKARKIAESDTFAFADEQQAIDEEDRQHQAEVDRSGGATETKTDKLEELLVQIREAILQNKPLPPIELQEAEIS